MAEIHIHIIIPTAAPSDPYVALYAPKWPMYQEKRAEVINHPMAAAPLPTESHCQRAARQQFLEGEGLDEIIVPARAKTLDTVVNSRQVCQEQHRGRNTFRAEQTDNRQPVEPGQHPVEDDDVESLVGSDLEAFAAVCGKHRLMTARPKPRGDERCSLRIVLDDQGLHACFDSGTGASSPDPNLTPWPPIGYTAWRRSQFAGRR